MLINSETIFILNKNGKKSKFNPTIISSILGKAFNEYYGADISKKRKLVQEIMKTILDRVTSKIKADTNKFVTHKKILEYIVLELKNKNLDNIEELVLLQNFDKINSKKINYFLSIEDIDLDPIWDIEIESEFEVKNNISLNEKLSEIISETHELDHEFDRELETIGFNKNLQPIQKKRELERRDYEITEHEMIGRGTNNQTIRLSDWISFFNKIFDDYFIKLNIKLNRSVFFEKLNKEIYFKKLSEEEWLNYFNNIFLELSDEDFTFLDFQNYFNFYAEGMKIQKISFKKVVWEPFLFLSFYENKNYQQVFYNHIKNFKKQIFKLNENLFDENNIDDLLFKISQLLVPKKDFTINSLGLYELKNHEVLLELQTNLTTNSEKKQGEKELEPPQFCFMRTSIFLALISFNKNINIKNNILNKVLEKIQEYYSLISEFVIIPDPSILRDSLKENAKIIENYAAVANDSFESAQESIYLSSINTKYSGNFCIDYSMIRSKGREVGKNRTSQGVCSFVRAIDETLKTQNRFKNDKPITVSLSLWHLDIEDFLINQKNTSYIQYTIDVSDVFINKLKKNDFWYMFDYSDIEKLGYSYSTVNDNYDDIVNLIIKEKIKFKKIKARLLFNKIISTINIYGSPFVFFKDNYLLSSKNSSQKTNNKTMVINGINGVGFFEVLVENKNQTNNAHVNHVKWPAISFNISKIIDKNIKVDSVKLKKYISTIFDIFFNIYEFSEKTNKDLNENNLIFKPICLGIIGLKETLDIAILDRTDKTTREKWIWALGEAISMSAILADLDLSEKLIKNKTEKTQQEKLNLKQNLYNPKKIIEKIKEKNKIEYSLPEMHANWELAQEKIQKLGHYFSSRIIFAPFDWSANIAGVTPGGLGNQKFFKIIKIKNKEIYHPTPFYFLLRNNLIDEEERVNFDKIIQNPKNPQKWKNFASTIALSSKNFKSTIDDSILLRPWTDQGVTLTLDMNIKDETFNLSKFILYAWEMGIVSVKFNQ